MSASGSGESPNQTASTENVAANPLPKAYLLNPGDHPGLSLSSAPLTKLNYMSWKHEIITSLLAKGKLGFITRKLPMPTEEAPEFEA